MSSQTFKPDTIEKAAAALLAQIEADGITQGIGDAIGFKPGFVGAIARLRDALNTPAQLERGRVERALRCLEAGEPDAAILDLRAVLAAASPLQVTAQGAQPSVRRLGTNEGLLELADDIERAINAYVGTFGGDALEHAEAEHSLRQVLFDDKGGFPLWLRELVSLRASPPTGSRSDSEAPQPRDAVAANTNAAQPGDGIEPITDSCGCVFCDIGIDREEDVEGFYHLERVACSATCQEATERKP